MHFYTQTDKGVEPRHYVPMASRPNELRPTRMGSVVRGGMQYEYREHRKVPKPGIIKARIRR